MGAALASALLAAGTKVTVWNRSPERYASLLEQGANGSESLAAAIETSGLTVVCLLDHPTTESVFAAEGVAEAVAGRKVVQFSFSNGPEASAFHKWVEERGGDHLHGQIKAYPREIGTPAARLTYAGARATFDSIRETVAPMGEPVYLGPDLVAACVVSNASAVLYELIVMAFFECAAYAQAGGGDLETFMSLVPTALRLGSETIDYSHAQIVAGDFAGDEASIDTHINALKTAMSFASGSGQEPPLAGVLHDYIAKAQAEGLGALEISAVYGMLADSLSLSHPAGSET
jgi:3-hydroxyisobutyrate dehydrogenase-like beta-hydroxyacid dehydrogenase